MDPYEATRVVFSRIQNLDPENASKIMGLLLIQDHGEKEMIRLAFGPETLVHSVVLKARKELGLPSNSPTTPSTPSSPSPFLARQNSSPSASRLSNGGINIPPPSLTIPNTTSSTTSWAALCEGQNQDELVSPHGSLAVGASPSSMNSSALPFYGSSSAGTSDVMDDFQLHDQLSFLNDNSPSSLGYKNQDVFYPQGDLASSPSAADHMLLPSYGGWGGSVHRRSCSVNDVCLGSDDQTGGFGWKPCMYFARGYCKNGTSCKFLHGGLGESTAAVVGADGGALVGSPNKLELMDKCHELLRSKAAQQQRLAAASQLMASSSFPYSPKSMNLFLQQQNDAQRAAAALMMNEDMHKFGRSRLERNEIVNPASRQIYLTFPADSTFREEDVSSYFSIYGPVEDVRIPYQQKRMFGFVTFVYPETVKIILAKGNPHFVCDSRVLVKPYKEKGKASDKKQQQQQVERGEFSPCGTPTGMESRDPFDLQIGPRMFNAQDILWRRKLEEQADLQQALELQSRRLMNLQLLDVRKQHHLRAFSTGSPIASPTQSPNLPNQNIVLPPIHGSQNVWEDKRAGQKLGISVSNAADQMMQQTTNATGNEEWAEKCDNGKGKESSPAKDIDLPENLEHNLPDNPFAYPSKTSSDATPTATSNMDKEGVTTTASSSTSMVNGNVGNSTMPPTSSSMEMSSFKSFNCQMPRLSSGHGAIGMPAGSGGPTCPVGI